jgi:beta-xylosidase
MISASALKAHKNPVYPDYFADPFVWKFDKTYYAIGTGAADAAGKPNDKAFTILQSKNLLDWKFAAHALLRPDPRLGNNYWAPEVAYEDERFFLYYSVGHGDKNHQLRVAVSKSPTGPYTDLDPPLTDPAKCAFAIDPHPFRDDNGQWYLFYARDFLDTTGGRAGTGLMVAKMETMTQLAGEGLVVLRPRSDWQRFLKDRSMYGGVWDWHTLEGPCVRKHQGHYYCFYSGGRWETENYGVDYGVSENVMGPYSDFGNEAGPRVLRTVPGNVLGPGHNSIARGPDDDETEYLVYHAWDKEMKARRMCIDRLIWTHDGPRCEGPTYL